MPSRGRAGRLLGIALPAALAAGMLLQLGPAAASRPARAIRTQLALTKQQARSAYGKLPLAFTPRRDVLAAIWQRSLRATAHRS